MTRRIGGSIVCIGLGLAGCDAESSPVSRVGETVAVVDTGTVCEPRSSMDRCNALDDDCDGIVDEDPELVWFFDADGDGFGSGEAEAACAAPSTQHVQQSNDCDDSDPLRSPGRREAEDCADGLDGDCDEQVDCDDPDCAGTEDCTEDCEDGLDNDRDGRTDCEDSDCAGAEVCIEDCEDGLDNDRDGRTDCEDSDCTRAEVCIEDCGDGLDNDRDGRTDCEDSDCISSDCAEGCADSIDNDADGRTDCDDDDCWGTPDCPAVVRAQLTAGSGTYGRLLTADLWPADTVYWLEVNSATGWVSTWTSTHSWRSCAWEVSPWSGYMTGSIGLYMTRGIPSSRFHFDGSCSATASQMPNEGFFAFSRAREKIFAYRSEGAIPPALWYNIPSVTTTTLTYTPARYRVLQASFELDPSDTWQGW